MLNQVLISNTSYQAKWYADVLLNKLTTMSANGEDISVCKSQFILLTKWIEIMDSYTAENYDTEGNITPTVECLTQQQMLELVAKVKVMLGTFVHIANSDWILANGTWVDGNFWRDSAFWIDSPII